MLLKFNGTFIVKKLFFVLLVLCASVAPAKIRAQEIHTPAEMQAVEVPTEPVAPFITSLNAVSKSSLVLQWQMTGEASGRADFSGFRIYRNGEFVVDLPPTAREFRDQNLPPYSVQFYNVAARWGETEARSPSVADITKLPNESDSRTTEKFDIVVVGATPGGIAAALTAARLGDKVALISPGPWIGGMMTGGLSRTDFGSMKSAGGLFKEFTDRARAYYTKKYGPDSLQLKASRNGYYFEPRVAKWIFSELLAEQPNITVLLDHYPRDVVKVGNRVTALYVLDRPRMIRKTLQAKIFIDATYEGDVAAQAGAAYRIGRESRGEFGEQHAGELFWEPVARKVVFGSGAGDRKVQAYNYRLCLTNNPENLLPFPAPTRYDRERYVTLLPDIASGRVKNMEQVLSILPLPEDKFDANNHPLGNPSSDLIGGSDNYPEADLWARENIAKAHREHVLGLLYFVQHDSEVPESFREEALKWGFAYDEFVDNGRFPTQLYVREGRRIEGDYLFTQNDAQSLDPEYRPNFHTDSIAVADYPIDSHGTSPEREGLLEGFFYLPGTQTRPSQVPYRVMTPRGVEGVLVSVCVSCTHIGYGTLRMEPVFMSLGTTAGTAAHLALQRGVLPSQISESELQRELLKQQHVICVFNDVPLEHPDWQALQWFGARGFFPTYQAQPDETLTRAQAAQWLWQWLQMQKPNLKPFIGNATFADVRGDHPEYLAVQSLLHEKIIDNASVFSPAENLDVATMKLWVKRAAARLKKPEPNLAEVNSSTRGEFCRQLYEIVGSV